MKQRKELYGKHMLAGTTNLKEQIPMKEKNGPICSKSKGPDQLEKSINQGKERRLHDHYWRQVASL
jgi:hypothetical protein